MEGCNGMGFRPREDGVRLSAGKTDVGTAFLREGDDVLEGRFGAF